MTLYTAYHSCRAFGYATSGFARTGAPKIVLHHEGGLGDQLLCSSVFKELRLRNRKHLWMMTYAPDLYLGNPDIDAVVPSDERLRSLLSRLKRQVIPMHYSFHDRATDVDAPPRRHLIAEMCHLAGIRGPISVRPYIHLTKAEMDAGQLADNQVAIQSSCMGARAAMQNKNWYAERFQTVADALRNDHPIIQLGSPADPPLTGVTDLRGRTSVRETAAILSRSSLFIGLVGFLMHLARAVDLRSVIVYGGRENPDISGYSSNENLTTALECSPCWKWNACDYDRECMRRIAPEQVIEAARTQMAKFGTPIETQARVAD